MAKNSSSNDSLLHPDIPSDMYCFFTRPGSFTVTAFFITSILLLLPLCILIIYLGLQRWRQQRSTSAAAAMTSHSDSFTYHMVAMELIGFLGFIICCCGIYGDVNLFFVGFSLYAFTWYGETFFHILTCVERYLAVVHPITYLSLRGERGIRLRNISIGCVWLLCFASVSVIALEDSIFFDFGILFVSLIIISFCSLSVLLVLIRAGPGEQGGDRERVDHSKRRAFYTILAILGVLLLRICGSVLWAVFHILVGSIGCSMTGFDILLNIPSSLVLPLLFLHRAGTLSCCKKNTK